MPIEYRGIEDIRIAVQAWDHDVRILHIPLETRVLSLGLGNEGHLMGLRNLLFQRHSMCFLLVFRFQRVHSNWWDPPFLPFSRSIFSEKRGSWEGSSLPFIWERADMESDCESVSSPAFSYCCRHG